MIFHGIAVKPGKPTAFARVGTAGRSSACRATRPRACRTRTSCSSRSCARPRACRSTRRGPSARRSASASSRRPAAISSTRSASRDGARASRLQRIGRHHQPLAGRRLHRDSRRSGHGRGRNDGGGHALLSVVLSRLSSSSDRVYRRPIRPFVLLLEDVRGVEIERGRGARVGAAELGVAAVADGQVLQPAVDDQIDERGAGEML